MTLKKQLESCRDYIFALENAIKGRWTFGYVSSLMIQTALSNHRARVAMSGPPPKIKTELVKLARIHIVHRRRDYESFLEMCREAVNEVLKEMP